MKRIRLILLIILAAMMLTACAASEDGIYSGKLVLDGDLVIPAGETEVASVLLLNGSLTIEEGGELIGNVYHVLGTFNLGGLVDGEIIQFSGSIVVSPQAQVTGNLQISGGTINGPIEQVVAGEIENQPVQVPFSAEWFQESFTRQLGWSLAEIVLLTVLAWILAVSIPRPIDRISSAASKHIIVSTAMGLLAGIVSLALIIQMVFTVLLIPVSFLGLLLLFVSVGFGWVGFGVYTGRWLTKRFDLNWSAPLTAATGTLVFMLIINLIGYLPGIGDLLTFISAIIGIGAVFLTRFGAREFVPAS